MNSINTVKELSNQELQAKVKELTQELNIAKSANVEIQNVNDSLAKRVDTIELESRTEKISNIVSGAYVENADEKVAAFVKSGLSVDEISKIVAPLKSGRFKQAALYKSDVAIKNEPNGNSPKNSWASNFLDLVGGNQ